MPRVTFVKKARKDVPGTDIKAGESYYWWKFRFGGKHTSRTPPKPAQLTQSAYFQELYGIQDDIAALEAGPDLEGEVEAIAERLRELGDEQQEKHDNMPEGLQEGDTGQLLEQRQQDCEAAADELEGIDFDCPDMSDKDNREEWGEDEESATQAWWDAKLEEVQAVTIEMN